MWTSISLVAVVAACSTVVAAEPSHQISIGAAHENQAARYAQAAREQHSSNGQQMFYDIVADGGAACNGDVVTANRAVTIGKGSRELSVSKETFSNSDVGKAIVIPGAGNGGGKLFAKIVSIINSQSVILDRGAGTGISAASNDITYGTDDAPKFMAFNQWARENQGAKQVILTVPKGASCWFGSSVWSANVRLANAWAAGIRNLIVEGTGATINSVGGAGFWLGGHGVCQAGIAAPNGCSARIETAQTGAKQIRLTPSSLAAGYISRFPVGKWLMIGGLDTQGLWKSAYGFPPNQTFFEWRQVTSVDTATGLVTLDRPLSDTYLSTWPNFNQGSNFEADNGGPATIWAVGDTWNSYIEYRGLTINQEGQTYSPARHVTYRGVTFGGAHGGIPTQNETWSAINSSFANVNMETDKLVGTILFDGVTILKLVNQSTSTKRLIIRNSVFTGGLDGGAQYTEITDSKLGGWAPGVWAYGSLRPTDTTSCTRCTISSINYTFGPTSSGAYNYWTKSGGIITIPNAAAQGFAPGQRYFVPGSVVYYSTVITNPPVSPLFACCESIGSFQVTAISGDPWPAVDNQTLTTPINISSGSKNLNVPSGPFVSDDVGKSILVNRAGNAGGQLRTFITRYSSATDVTLYNAAGATVAGSQTIQWGTSNTYIGTNQAGTLPNLSALSTTGVVMKTTGTPNITCDVCNDGDPTSDGYGISIQAGAIKGKPLGSYIRKQYTPTTSQGNLAPTNVRGVFKSLSINVTTPATSAGSVTLYPGGQFHWFLVDNTKPLAPSYIDWLPKNLAINLKQSGNRIITANGVTCNGSPGGCSGDTITPPKNLAMMWLPFGSMTPYMGSAHTGAPTFTITVQTDPLQ